MGSELSTIETVGGQGSRIWLNLLRLALGQIDHLSLAPNSAGAGFEVRATGILKSYYGHALLSLARSWNAQAFWYDWRKNLDEAADQLRFKSTAGSASTLRSTWWRTRWADWFAGPSSRGTRIAGRRCGTPSATVSGAAGS